jgi:hypothetical protein
MTKTSAIAFMMFNKRSPTASPLIIPLDVEATQKLALRNTI